MENVLSDDLPVGVYHSNNMVKNLKIKVKLKKMLNVCLEEKDTLDLQDSIELVNLMKSPSKEIEHTFAWQEKNKKQIETTGNENQSNDLDNITLVSLSDTDIFDMNWKSTRSSTHPPSLPNYIENMITDVKSKRFLLHSQNHKTWQKPFFLLTKQLVKTQTCHKRASPFPSCQSMVIMAHLNYEDSPREEIELCYLRIDTHGVLTVIPDFCNDKAYTFLNSRSETFQYSLENILDSMEGSKNKNKKDILKKIQTLHRYRLDSLVGNEFFVPPPNTVLCCLNCEIVSASDFLAKDIFIHYRFEVPDGCILKSDILEGVTQTCRCKQKYQNTVAYFGYVFSQEIEIHLEKFQNNLMPKLQFIIEVNSIDKWGNFRNEGYGYCEIILKSGISISKINTWMLRPTSLTNQLRHFFIGGTPCLENLSYVRVPSDAKESELSKYGLRTETSGQVTVKSSVVLHAGAIAS